MVPKHGSVEKRTAVCSLGGYMYQGYKREPAVGWAGAAVRIGVGGGGTVEALKLKSRQHEKAISSYELQLISE